MRWAQFFILVLATTYAKEDETNEITPPRPPINLDANLRRALLKALTELENEENEKQSQGTIHLPHLDTRDKIVEKASASALSFFASTDSSPTTQKLSTTTTTTEKATYEPIVLIQKSNGVQHRPIITLENTEPVNDAEQILTSATSSFTSNKFSYSKTENQEARSSSKGANSNFLSNAVKSTTKVSKPVTIETTTLTTTTSTEESEAKVEDVQFFSAPLVAAFTVHQDERGLPKSVEPIFKSLQNVEPKVMKEPKLKPEPINQHQQEQIRTQLALQEKQRALEEEILRLKQQQQQQNYLIRQQQILHEHQLQIQKQKILDEQTRIRNNQQPFVPIINTSFNQPTQQRNQFNSDNSKAKGSVVSFQPSISFTSNQHQAGLLPLNAQQLPVKNAVDFRSPLTSTANFPDFNYLSQQQPPLANSVSNFNLVSTIQPQLSLTAPKHTRVFRQEANTANFFNNGFNNHGFNGFTQVPVQQQNNNNNNRFFRSNAEYTFTSSPYNFNNLQPPAVNQHLNNLLYNSGIIRGKQHDDLNIVSKVLALNHYGGDYRFGSSNVNEQRVPAPSLIKEV